ncbi:hypothetical protein C9374_014194 [Naegleria lovaniensis]|uniref:Uncharacterized protein n=1 Tax=Naegleria lovaniensis TaxID=51637 RepID=A0AA88KPY4_NAELO|nr:uncharacterized protein C9374_014194 [Naegleria lovaniensis]KAG2389634.1 hypothetical protein C9374_014194 [Naegleria lovaniensis]
MSQFYPYQTNSQYSQPELPINSNQSLYWPTYQLIPNFQSPQYELSQINTNQSYDWPNSQQQLSQDYIDQPIFWPSYSWPSTFIPTPSPLLLTNNITTSESQRQQSPTITNNHASSSSLNESVSEPVSNFPTHSSSSKEFKWKQRLINQYNSSPPITSIVGKVCSNDRICLEETSSQLKARYFLDVKQHLGLTHITDDIVTNSFNYKCTDYFGDANYGTKTKRKEKLLQRLGGHDIICKMDQFKDIYEFLGMLRREGLLNEDRMKEEGLLDSMDYSMSKQQESCNEQTFFSKESNTMSQIKNHQTENHKKRNRNDNDNQNKKKTSARHFKLKENTLKQVLIKNRKVISNKAVDELRTEGHVKNLTPSPTLLHAQSTTDLICTDIFNVKVKELDGDRKIIYHSILPTVCCYVLQHKKWIGFMKKKQIQLCKEDQIDNKDLIVALNLDYAANSKLTTLTITVINSKCFGTGQSRAICVPLAIWSGDESEFIHVADHFRKEIEIIRKHGITIESNHCSIDVFLTMDLKALGVVCPGVKQGSWCPYCDTCSPICCKNHKPRTQDSLGCILGLPACNIIICVLHAKERLCENVLRITLSGVKEKDKFWDAVIKIKGLEGLQKVEDEEWNDVRMFLHGNTCNILLNNVGVMSPFFEKEQTQMLWDALKCLLNNIDKNASDQVISESLSLFWNIYVAAAQGFQGKCWYAHILAKHFLALKRRVRNVKQFETQAFESNHLEEKESIEGASSKGGGTPYSYYDYILSNTRDYLEHFSSNGIKVRSALGDNVDDNKDLLMETFCKKPIPTGVRSTIKLGQKGKLLAQVLFRKLRILFLSTVLPNTFMLCQPKRFKEKRKQEIASDYTVKVNDDESILQQLCYREEDTTVFENHSCSDQCVTVPKDYQHYTISTLNRVA